MSDSPHSGPPPLPDDDGIQADAPRPTPRRAPKTGEEPIVLGDEYILDAPPAKRAQPAVERETHLFDRAFPIKLGRPTFALVFSLLAFAGMAVVSGLVAGPFWLFGAIYLLLMVLAVALYFTRPTHRTLRITADGIELTRPDERLDYDEMLEVYTPDEENSRGRNFAIHLLHAHGTVTIPPSVVADSGELADFLETQPFGVREVPKVPALLRDFLKQQMTVHGADRVYVYRARLTQPTPARLASTLWVAVTLLLVGAGLTALGALQRVEGLIACGIGLAAVMALVCLLVALHKRFAKPPIKNWQQAVLVIGPDGLALVQGDLEGELRWRELKSVKMGKGVVGTSSGAARNAPIAGIHLHVAGATITVADIYHWPLTHALEQIERYRNRRARR